MIKLSKIKYNKTRLWMYRNARPIDFARWQYHFEDAQPDTVLNVLKAYQNPDGGFGHSLESDSWNPNSSPIQTWAAVELLREIGINDNNNEVIQEILRYLELTSDFTDGKWLNTVKSNNEYPHAPWWHWNEEEESNYNPTACLVGFALKFAKEDSPAFNKAVIVAKAAIKNFIESEKVNDGHLLLGYLRLLRDIRQQDRQRFENYKELRNRVEFHIKRNLQKTDYKWCCDGVNQEYIKAFKESILSISDNADLPYDVGEILINKVQEDGTWKIVWKWNQFDEEWAVTENWWKAYGILANMIYLKEFNMIE